MEMVSYAVRQEDLHEGRLAIMPVGDIQWDGKGGATSLNLLQQRIDDGMREKALFLGMGDYIDFVSPSNRQRLRSAALYDTAMNVIDSTAKRLVDEVAEILRPTTGRWLGLLEGHHFHEFAAGHTSDQYLADLLHTRHLGTTAYVGLSFNRTGNRTSGIVWLWATHGCGNGQRAGSPVTKLDSVQSAWDADIFIMGHQTKMAHAPTNRIYPSSSKAGLVLHHRDIHLVGAGGFSKGYDLGTKQGSTPRGSYVEQGMMRPAALGCPIIRIKPVRDRWREEGKQHEVFEREITVEL